MKKKELVFIKNTMLSLKNSGGLVEALYRIDMEEEHFIERYWVSSDEAERIVDNFLEFLIKKCFNSIDQINVVKQVE